MLDRSSALRLDVVVARLGDARSVDGRTVEFADGVRAVLGSSGLWHQNVRPIGATGLGRIPERDLTRQLFGDDVRGSLVFARDAVDADRVLRRLIPAVRGRLAELETPPLIGRLTPSPQGPAAIRTMPIADVGEWPVLAVPDHPDRGGSRRSSPSQQRPLSVAVLSSATRSGLIRLTPDEANGFLDELTVPETLVVADEREAGFFRTGPAFGFEQWDRRPDIVVLGPGVINGCGTVHALAGFAPWDRVLPTGYEPSPAEIRQTTIVAETIRRLRAEPRRAARSVELLGDAVATLVDSRLAVNVSGGGWVYAVTPAVPGRRDPDGLGRLLEALRLEELWIAATRDGDLLLSPLVDGSPADIARIVDSLHGGISRLIHH